VIFIFFGITAMIMSQTLPMGNAGQMGPGYFPYILGGILLVLGLVVAIRALFRESAAIKPIALRPLLGVIGGVLAFAFVLQPFGLILAIFLLIGISRWAGWNSRYREMLILFIILAGLAVGVFIYGLKLPIKVWFK
jgi:hypothetical protein